MCRYSTANAQDNSWQLVHKAVKSTKKGTETLSYLQWLGLMQDPCEVSHPSQIAERTTEEYDLLLTTQKTLLVLLERLRNHGTRWG